MSKKNKINPDNDPSSIPPVGWYDPAQLWDTATHVTESDTFSRNADRRITYTEWEEKNGKDGPKPMYFNNFGQRDAKTEYDNNKFSIGWNRENKEEIWIDFVADTGDGGNATYTVAKTLFEDSLAVLVPADNPIRQKSPADIQILPRADLLVLGGDLVYPVASEDAYQERFTDIFKAALPINEGERKEIDNEELDSDANQHSDYYKMLFRAVVAFPQNHDWYDNLSSFTLLFSHKEKETFLDMKCPQSQSYAAVKLPKDWWLFGLDFGLSDDIDVFQFEYFKKIINHKNDLDENDLHEKSRIIIEYCEPVWRTTALGWREKMVGNNKNTAWCYRYEELERMIEKKTNRAIDIRIAGDQHHYRRYTSRTEENNSHESESHLITCGSGGAFLHPTHGPAEFETIYHIRKKHDSLRTYTFSEEDVNNLSSEEKTRYKKEQDYPSSKKSWKLSFWNLGFLFINPKFGCISAFSYFLIVWANFSSLFSNIKTADFEISNRIEKICYQLPIQWNHNDLSFFDQLSCSWRLWSWSTILSPLNALIMIFVIFGFYFFAREFNPHAKRMAGILGFLHGCAHFFAIFIIYFFVLFWLLNKRDPIEAPLELVYFFITGVLIFLFSWLLGSTIMGFYLFFTLNIYHPFVAVLASIITLAFSYLIFAMWFDTFYSGLLLIPIIAALVALFLDLKLKKEIPFLHSNEAFSSIREQKYKGFLRFRITKDRLEAFFIGIDEIPEKWEKEDPAKAVPKWRAIDKSIPPKPVCITPKLVDYWTVETPQK